jgi:hypothetical protein
MNEFLPPARNDYSRVAPTVGRLCAAMGEVLPRPIVGAARAVRGSVLYLPRRAHRHAAVGNQSEWRTSCGRKSLLPVPTEDLLAKPTRSPAAPARIAPAVWRTFWSRTKRPKRNRSRRNDLRPIPKKASGQTPKFPERHASFNCPRRDKTGPPQASSRTML